MAFGQLDMRASLVEDENPGRNSTACRSAPSLDDSEDMWFEGLHPVYSDESEVTQYVSVNSHFSKIQIRAWQQ